MLYVDGMNGVINHNETIQWLYTLIGSKFRLVVKTALKLLLVFVEYSESNAPLLTQAVASVDAKRGAKPWSNVMEILEEKDGVDTELLVYAMTLVNKHVALRVLIEGFAEQRWSRNSCVISTSEIRLPAPPYPTPSSLPEVPQLTSGGAGIRTQVFLIPGPGIYPLGYAASLIGFYAIFDCTSYFLLQSLFVLAKGVQFYRLQGESEN
uniref:Formin homology 2 domain containing 3 n=1 Tax=Ornithorhynchus anatinus TaxID=9258 RepID=A0A6I8PL35_ORNAN